MPFPSHVLGFKCPECGLETGSLRRKVVKLNQKALTEKNMPAHKVKKHFVGDTLLYQEDVSLKKNAYVYKYDTFFGIEDPDRKPIMNLSEYDISRTSNTFMQNIERITLTLVVLKEIIPLLLEKYPVVRVRFKDFIAALELIVEYCKPLIDGRWDRSWAEWEQIVEYAQAFGYRAASRKFYSIKDGKRQYLSARYIRQKLKSANEFERKLKDVPHFVDYFKQLMSIVKDDFELLEKCKQIGKKYAENKSQTMMQLYDGEDKVYSYTYYYIRHYDPKIHKKKMSDYKKGKIKKSQVIGKRECGPFKEIDLLKAIDEYMQFKETNHTIGLCSKLVFILSFQPSSISLLTEIVGNETRDEIELSLEVLIETGVVKEIRLNNKSEINDELYKNLNTSALREDLYYILDKSNPNVDPMLEDYKTHCTTEEIQSIVRKVSEYKNHAITKR